MGTLCLTCIISTIFMFAALAFAALAFVTADARETAVTSDDQINCGACKGLFDEIDYLVSKVPDYASIDTGSQREWGKDSKKKSYARSEVHLYEVLEVACHQMENYSGFEEQGRKVYKRYQNRTEHPPQARQLWVARGYTGEAAAGMRHYYECER